MQDRPNRDTRLKLPLRQGAGFLRRCSLVGIAFTPTSRLVCRCEPEIIKWPTLGNMYIPHGLTTLLTEKSGGHVAQQISSTWEKALFRQVGWCTLAKMAVCHFTATVWEGG